jgi:hypothetical protein
MGVGMGLGSVDDRWVTVRLAVADLLSVAVSWEGGPSSPNWPLMRPPLLRLARIARRLDEDDAGSARPADPVLRVELLAAADAAAAACGQLNGPGRQHDVAYAAAVLNTALWKIPRTDFRFDQA